MAMAQTDIAALRGLLADVEQDCAELQAGGNGIHCGVHCFATTEGKDFATKEKRARLIAAAHNSLPGLLDELEAARAKAERLERESGARVAELAREREDARDIPTIAYMSGAADYKARAEAAEAKAAALEAELCDQLVEHPGRKAMLLVLQELRRAKLKHPHFADSQAQACTVLMAEVGELAAAVLRAQAFGPHGAQEEAAQVAGVCLRFIEMLLQEVPS
jgi:NTP pyrophosphatase (non-canonical NTP hydrolase)